MEAIDAYELRALALELAARACSGPPLALEIAAQACSDPPVALEIDAQACSEPPVALEIAAQACSKPPVALEIARGSRSLLGPARSLLSRSKSLRGLAWSRCCSCHLLTSAFTIRSRCSRLLGSVSLISIPLNSAPTLLRAWICTGSHEHTHIYIEYIYI